MLTRLKLPIILSGLATVLFYWGNTYKPSLPKASSKHTLEKLSDLNITGLKVQFFDIEGHLTHGLTSPKVQHVPHHDTYHLSSPSVYFTPINKPQWTMRSDDAIATEKAQEIILSHHVIIKHAPFQTHPAGRIETERLTFYPKKNYATTKETIKWTQQDNFVISQGMNAYFNDGRIDLFQTKAMYEPTT